MWTQLLELLQETGSEKVLRAVQSLLAPGVEAGLAPTLRLRDGRLYLPTMQLLLNLRTLECKSFPISELADLLTRQEKGLDID
jgi:hypothetical protein